MPDRSVVRLLVALACVVVLVAGLKAAAGLLAPALLSLFLVLACTPLTRWLRSCGLPAWLVYTLVTLGVVAVGFLFLAFLAISIQQLTAALPGYRELLDERFSALEAWLNSRGLESSDIFELEFFRPTRLIQLSIDFLTGTLGVLTNAGLTLFIFIYMLTGAESFAKKLARGLGRDSAMLARLNSFARSISIYLLIKGWLGAMTALGQTVLLLFLGVDFAVLWGVLSFLFNFVPNIGYIVALVPPLCLALIESGFVKGAIVFVGYAVINNFFDMAIGPKYLGKGLDLSTLVTFLAVIFWTWILGPIGAFMALPLTVMLKKLVLEPFDEARLLAVLAASGDSLAADEGDSPAESPAESQAESSD